MTAFCIDIRRDRLAVAGDTMGYLVAEELKPLGFMSKVLAIPHLRAVLFGRGITAIGYRVGFDLMVSPQYQTLEAAADALPAMLRGVTEAYADENGIDDYRDHQIFEAVFAGYSLRDKRTKLWAMHNYNTEYEHAEVLPEGVYGTTIMPVLPPEFALSPDAARLPLEKRLIAGMQAARRYCQSGRTPQKAIIGGEIQITEVTADGVGCRTVARFPDYEQTAHASAAVASRVLRGDEEVDVRDGLVAVGDMVTAGGGAASGGGMSRQQRRAAEKAARKAAGRRAA
jgi:hypothetical protein